MKQNQILLMSISLCHGIKTLTPLHKSYDLSQVIKINRKSEMLDSDWLKFKLRSILLTCDQKKEKKISVGSRLLGPKKSSLRDARSRLLVFLDPRSRVDEMQDLAFSPSWTQEVELTRCRISSSHLLGPKRLSLRDARSRLLVFLDQRSRGDEMPDLAFSSSWTQ